MSEDSASPRSAIRQRAPRRQGHRAQLTVPADAWDRAQQLAREQGTTPNDILAQLVLRGLDIVERERATALVAESRIGAYRRRHAAGSDDDELPTVEQAEEQALALRRDLADGT